MRTILESRSADRPIIGTRFLRVVCPVGNLIDRHCWDTVGVRVAIVAESFLPNVNGVTNSVLRVIEHLRRTGHEALVIAPIPRPASRPPTRFTTASGCTGCRRGCSPRSPRCRSVCHGRGWSSVLRGFDPDVVHLASPALLGYGGLQAARFLGVPTVAVYQTDVPGFAESYGIGITARAAWAWFRHLHRLADRTLAPSTAAMESLVAHRIPRVHKWARGVDIIGYAPSARDETPAAALVAGRQADRRLRRSAGAGEARRAARRRWPPPATCRWSSSATASTARKLQSAMPTAVFTGALYGEELAAAYASMDVFVHAGEHETFCQVVQEAMASGLPVIAPDAGGPRDLVTPWRTGLLLGVKEFEAQAARTRSRICSKNGTRYSVAARRSVLGRTWPAICDELLGHYEAVQSPIASARHAATATRAEAVTCAASPAPARRPAATAPTS